MIYFIRIMLKSHNYRSCIYVSWNLAQIWSVCFQDPNKSLVYNSHSQFFRIILQKILKALSGVFGSNDRHFRLWIQSIFGLFKGETTKITE